MNTGVVPQFGEWAAAIRSAWQKSVAGIFECGRLLVEAKAALPHGDFGAMCETDLPFSASTAQILMKVASDARLANPDHGRYLPSSWRTLYELTKLDDDQWAMAVKDGAIRPDMERREVVVLRKPITKYTNGTAPDEDTCTVEDLSVLAATGKKFGTVYADPPWLYGNQATRASTDNHYDGMSVDQICKLAPHVQALSADVAHLHLWTTNGFLFDARRVMEEWGFEYRSCFVWVKPQMGIGNYWRVSHEFLLLGIRGSQTFLDKGLRSWGEFRRAAHSAKPHEVRLMVERASPGPRLELFGRLHVDNWTVWGNQIRADMFHEVAA